MKQPVFLLSFCVGCVWRPWRSSWHRWSRITLRGGVPAPYPRSLRTCRTSRSAKETVWARSFPTRYSSQLIMHASFIIRYSECRLKLQFLFSCVHRWQTGLERPTRIKDTQVSAHTPPPPVFFFLNLKYITLSSIVLLDKYSSQFGGGSQYAYFHEEDEASFQLVDTAKTQKSAYQRNRMRFAQVRGAGWNVSQCKSTWREVQLANHFFKFAYCAHAVQIDLNENIEGYLKTYKSDFGRAVFTEESASGQGPQESHAVQPADSPQECQTEGERPHAPAEEVPEAVWSASEVGPEVTGTLAVTL